MKRLMIGLAVFAAIGLCDWCPGLRADDPAKDLPKPDPTKELATVQKEWEDARRAFATATCPRSGESSGSARSTVKRGFSFFLGAPFLGAPSGMTVRNDGQSPRRQE